MPERVPFVRIVAPLGEVGSYTGQQGTGMVVEKRKKLANESPAHCELVSHEG